MFDAACDQLTDPQPMRRPRNNLLVVCLVVALVAVLGGAGAAIARHEGESGSARPPALSATKPSTSPGPVPLSLRGVRLAIGSKDFDEQIILGQIAELLLEQAGAEVTDRTGLPSTKATRKALESSAIDLYWEYTGTGWTTHLGELTPLSTETSQHIATAAKDLQVNKIKWLSPFAPGNNTYSVVVRSEAAASLGVTSVSDLARLEPSALTFCVDEEFGSSPSGLSSLLASYGISVPDDNVRSMSADAVFPATDKGTICNSGEVFATDGRVKTLGLTRLVDDNKWAPAFNPAVTMRLATYEQHPEIEQILAPVTSALDTDTLTDLNAQVRSGGRSPEAVARQWLVSRGFLR